MRSRLASAIALGSLLAGCSMAPVYRVPQAPSAAASYNESPDWKTAAPADATARGDWWTIFHDEQLDALQGQVADANQDLKAALARLEQARDLTRVARSAYFPLVTAGPDVTRTRTSLNSPRYVAGRPNPANDFALDADVSYEVDLWGRLRNTVASARASEQASVGDLAALDLSIRSELAMDYFALRSLDLQQDLLDRTVADYADALKLTRNLYQGGAGVVADVRQAEAQLETARTQAEDTRLRRAQSEHAIAALVGRTATGFHIEAHPLALDVQPPPIDPGLPSALLERRPDVAAAERRVAAANAQIGVARAAYFPVFTLSALAGFESVASGSWIEAPSRTWAIGPTLLQTVFDGGLRSAQSDAARAAYDQQVAQYRGSVLTAYQEVEDALASLLYLARESASEQAAVVATQGALQQAEYRYKGGAATYLEVVSTENAALAARLSAADIQLRRMNAAVLLVKALGGGWHGAFATASAAAPSQEPSHEASQALVN
ncbi:MAG TPA: efflux transporter outer membrane subunit [Burkholderiaceae bacterium]|jgi:NodT family efflux transporter outer membrane factor (OMF) lipoprotein|nr:efflux transporter outer membrane subunit [Burkholderiaceae bacterium]